MTGDEQQRSRSLLPCGFSTELHSDANAGSERTEWSPAEEEQFAVRVVSGRAQWLRWPQLRLFYAAAAVTAVAGNNGRFTVPALCRGLELQLHVSIHDTYSRAWLFEERIQIML